MIALDSRIELVLEGRGPGPASGSRRRVVRGRDRHALLLRDLTDVASLAKYEVVKVVNMHEAKTTLSQLVEQAERGEEVLIARAGTPVARIVALRRGTRRVLGQWRGRVQMSDDFDAPLPPSEQRHWDGEDDS